MTINYDWYTINYRHAAAYATLIVSATVYNKTFTFNIGLKKSVDFVFLKFPGQFNKFRDCTGQPGTYGM